MKDDGEVDRSIVRRRGLRPRTAALVTGGVIVVAVAIGVAFTAGGGKNRTGDALPTTAATDQTAAPTTLAVPVVTAKYVAASKTVVFSWTVAGAKPGDRYVWARAEDDLSASRPTAARSASIVTGAPTATCIRVAYVPQEGSVSNAVRLCGPTS